MAPYHWIRVTISFIMCFLSTTTLVYIVWLRIGKEHGVQIGEMVSFFAFGGFLGTNIAGILNTVELIGWQHASEACNPMTIEKVSSVACNARSAIEWVLTPGLVEAREIKYPEPTLKLGLLKVNSWKLMVC